MPSYEVFTRTKAGDDLIHAGSVNAPNEKLARINAHDMYDEEDWHDMYIVPTSELVDVAPDELDAEPAGVVG